MVKVVEVEVEVVEEEKEWKKKFQTRASIMRTDDGGDMLEHNNAEKGCV